MIPIVEVAKGIFRIGPLDTHNSLTPATSPHLVVGDKQAAIVEMGEEGQAPALLEAIKEIGVSLDRIAYLIPTHIHMHHIGAVNFLLNTIPQAKFVVHHRGAPHVMEPTRLNEGTVQVWGEGCPQLSPITEDRILTVGGGEVFDLGGRELEIIETTGHAPHHVAIFDRLTRALFAGDALGVIGVGEERARPDIRPPLFDVEKAADSLHRLKALNPSIICLFGYGGISHSPAKTIQWSEDDIRAVERICREGMQQKMSNQEIARIVSEYYNSVGTGGSGPDPYGGGADRGGAPIGMIAYIKKQDPSLELPR